MKGQVVRVGNRRSRPVIKREKVILAGIVFCVALIVGPIMIVALAFPPGESLPPGYALVSIVGIVCGLRCVLAFHE
jgi:drug/metabolite transporter (DMT)-like permease